MKNIIVMVGLVFMMNANASIEQSASSKSSQPSDTEIAQNRACFQDLEVQGCVDPGEDPEHFRACMSNVHQTLDEHCQKLMLNLYGSK